jgi:hypothetical protein
VKGSNYKPNLSKNSRYKNGEILASKLKKFVITECSKSFVYRSSYEYIFHLWCENNGNVLKWSSEPYAITYFCPVKKKQRSYWLDFTMQMVDNKLIFVEIKPEKDLQAVKHFQLAYSRLTTSEARTSYIQANKIAANNLAKWQAAKKYALAKGAEFQVVTEKFLKQYT